MCSSDLPRLAANLVQFNVGILIHQDEHDIIGDGTEVEPEKVIVAKVHPTLTQVHLPQRQPAKHRQPRAQRRPKEFMFGERP